ncbi:MAG: hypothetical protein ABI629_09945 [bacterium]
MFSLVVSPDSRHLYVAGANSSTLVAFAILPDPPPMEVPALSVGGVAAMIVGLGFALLCHLAHLRTGAARQDSI